MTSANIQDVSTTNLIPVNPYKKDMKDSAKEDFLALMAGSVSAVNINTAKPNVSVDTDIAKGNVKAPEVSSNYNQNKLNISSEADNKLSTPELKEKIKEFEESVKDTLKEELGISDEEIEDAMEELALTYVDLTNPSNLAMLLKQIKGEEDATGLLLDGSVQEIFEDFSQLTESLISDTGMPVEEIKLVSELTYTEPTVSPEFSEVLNKNQLAESGEPGVEPKTDNEPTAEAVEDVLHSNKDTIVSENTVREADDAPVEDEGIQALSEKIVSVSKDDTNKNAGGNTNNQSESFTQTAANQTQTVMVNEAAGAGVVSNDFSQTINDISTQEAVITPYTDVDAADVINQVVENARVSITEQVRSMEIELNPVNLGRIFMQVSEQDGQITARLVTQNESVKNALDGAIMNLIDKLNTTGIKVEAVEVSVGTHEFEENLEKNFAQDAREDLNNQSSQSGQQDNRSRGGIHLGDPSYMEGAELSEEEELTASIMRTYGNTVNFTA